MSLRAMLGTLLLLAAPGPAGEFDARVGLHDEEFNDRVGVLEPFPREIGRAQEIVVRGSLQGAFRAPELIVIAPDGQTFLNKDNIVREHAFTFTVKFEHGPGPYRLEAIARKSNMIRWFARFTVWHGKRRPAAPPPEVDPPAFPDTPIDLHERLIEKRVFAMLNRFRHEVRLREAGWNEGVAARCREHAAKIARAERLLNRIGGIGVREMLAESGAGGSASGPRLAWRQLDSVRPFPRPQPQQYHENLRNHVVDFLAKDGSVEQMVHETFVTEAAYRICALDPYCVDIAVGVARPAVKVPKGTAPPKRRPIWFVICFVQINDKAILAAQDDAHDRLLAAAASRDPEFLRRLGDWGRPGRAVSLLDAARRDPRPEVAGAAFDGLLAVDEERARKQIDRAGDAAQRALGRHAFATAANNWRALAAITYDRSVAREAAGAIQLVEEAARRDLEEAAALDEPARSRALRALLARCGGLAIAAEIEAHLKG